MNFGEFLRSARVKRKITLRELSEITGISFSQLGKIEREEHKPTKENLLKIINSLEIDSEIPLRLLGYGMTTNKKEIIDPLIRYKVLVRDNFKCKVCGKEAPRFAVDVDLIVPKTFGGEVTVENMVGICEECSDGRTKFINEEGLEKEFLYTKYKLRNLLKDTN
ncbi:helix-turn-helix domain-containing protein [Neobacillus drentensis]|uniref:helix-turn-helix domain-containing protein n=1 Tax=Neobacillus drentensis TaxID=220684 RepID=UPI002FFF481C